MSGVVKCTVHNLPEEIVCIGEFCVKRIGCELCIAKHDHKFYLDTKNKDKNVVRVQQEVQDKLVHLKNYTKTNVKSLKLQNYRQKLEQHFSDERLYLKNKLDEERMNFEILMQNTHQVITDALEKYQQMIIQNWELYNKEAQRHLDSEKDYDNLMDFFRKGNWTVHDHVEQSINFLYSEELLFRFNRNLDKLKKEINHHKKENENILNWFYQRRNDFGKYELCPHATFKELIRRYDDQPTIGIFKKDHTKQSRDDQ